MHAWRSRNQSQSSKAQCIPLNTTYVKEVIWVHGGDVNALGDGVEVTLGLVERDVQADHVILTRHNQTETGARVHLRSAADIGIVCVWYEVNNSPAAIY